MDWWQYQVTQGFGPTSEQLDGGYAGYAHFNKGIDFAAPMGTPVRSVVSGTVVSAGDSGDGWGTSVKIRDAYGNTHNLGHLSAAQVQPGQTILAGQLVGASGSTGKSTGPHVSYDVWDPAGNFFDPYQFIAQAPGASPPMQVDPEDSFLADPGTAAPASGPAPAPSANPAAGGMPPGAQPTGDGGYTVWDPIVGKFAIYKPWYDSYTGQTSAPRFVGYEAPGTGSPNATQAPGTGTFVATQYNPDTGQMHRVVINEQTGRIVQWGDVVPQKPEDPSTRYITIPSGATPNAPTQFGGTPPSSTGKSAPNQWDAMAVFNAVTQGGAGQRFTQTLPSGHLTPQHSQLVKDVGANQYNNNEFILRSYGIDTSKADYQDPVAVAAIAATLGARQKGLVDQGYDPTFAASLIQYENENKAGISNPLSQQGISSPYSGGQQVIVGPDGHTYSAAAYKQAFG